VAEDLFIRRVQSAWKPCFGEAFVEWSPSTTCRIKEAATLCHAQQASASEAS